MAHCDEYLELISAAMDGALSPAQQETLDAHLAACPECKALYEELTAVHVALEELPPVEVPAGLTQRVMAAVARDAAPASKGRSRWTRGLACAAVAAVVLTAAWHLGRPGPIAGSDTARSDAVSAECAPAGTEWSGAPDSGLQDGKYGFTFDGLSDAVTTAGSADQSLEGAENGFSAASAPEAPMMAVAGAGGVTTADAPAADLDPGSSQSADPQVRMADPGAAAAPAYKGSPTLPQATDQVTDLVEDASADAPVSVQTTGIAAASAKIDPRSSADALALLLEHLELSGFSIDGDTANGPNDETVGFAGDGGDGHSYLFEYSRLVEGHTSRLGVYSVAPDTGTVTQLFP